MGGVSPPTPSQSLRGLLRSPVTSRGRSDQQGYKIEAFTLAFSPPLTRLAGNYPATWPQLAGCKGSLQAINQLNARHNSPCCLHCTECKLVDCQTTSGVIQFVTHLLLFVNVGGSAAASLACPLTDVLSCYEQYNLFSGREQCHPSSTPDSRLSCNGPTTIYPQKAVSRRPTRPGYVTCPDGLIESCRLAQPHGNSTRLFKDHIITKGHRS